MGKWFIEKSKLNIADMWLIPLDCVTFMKPCDHGYCNFDHSNELDIHLENREHVSNKHKIIKE